MLLSDSGLSLNNLYPKISVRRKLRAPASLLSHTYVLLHVLLTSSYGTLSKLYTHLRRGVIHEPAKCRVNVIASWPLRALLLLRLSSIAVSSML
jgi:hypothetical protein